MTTSITSSSITTTDLTVDSADNLLKVDHATNRVGIGTTSPSNLLTLKADSTEETMLMFQNDSAVDIGAIAIHPSNGLVIANQVPGSSVHIMTHDGNEDINLDSDGFIQFEVAGSELMRLTNTGVGIGTDNPDAQLHVNTTRTSSTNATSFILSDNVTGIQTDGVYKSIRSTSNNSNSISEIRFIETDGTNNNTAIAFATQSTAGGLTERLRVHRDGNVGIGELDPDEKLHIKNSTGSYIKHEGPSSGDYATGYQIFEGSTTSAAFYTNPTHDLTILSKDGMTFRLDNANRIKFTSTGNVGIGNTPADKLDVQGADNGITVRAITANRPVIKLVNGTTNMLQFSANGTYGAIGDGTDANRYMTFRDGYVTQPSQPSFDANSPNKTTAGNNIVYGSTRHNQGGHYSTSNGKFTAPIAGVYLFQYSVLLGNPMTGSYVRTLFRVNGTVSTGYGDTLNSKGNQTDYMSTNGALIIKLNANDYVNIYNEGQIVTYGANYGQFGGHLLG